MILGMPWLTHANPVIDWKTRTVKPHLGQESTYAPENFGYSVNSRAVPPHPYNIALERKETKEVKEEVKEIYEIHRITYDSNPTVSLTTGIHPHRSSLFNSRYPKPPVMITTITITELLLPYWEVVLRQLHPFVCLPFIIVFSFQL